MSLAELKKFYIDSFGLFEKSLNGESKLPIHSFRKDALNSFSKLSFPATYDEEWRYTNLSPLFKENFLLPDKKTQLSAKDIQKYLFNGLKGSLLVFVNGFYDDKLSKKALLPKGAVASNLNTALKENNEIIDKHFGKYADHSNHIFTALNSAFTREGAFIYIPDKKIVDDPIHLLFITDSDKEKFLIQPRNLIVAGKNSQVTVIEHYVSVNESIYFTNNVTEIVADENAVVDHVRVQEESKKAFHIARMEVDQERTSNFTSHLISFGAEIARNDFNARFNDEGGECTLNGLYLIGGNQLFDAHTIIDHAKPHCNSHEHYKGILDDKSRGVFNGKVMVRKDAQKTNAFQENNNIILSDEALVNTKPQLEIFADDVKCSHGATIGQLDTEAMFYLRSRGIGNETATAILIHAFASDVVQSIKMEPIKQYLEGILSARFNQ